MSLELYLIFVGASVLLVALPGPNVALIVATSLKHGAKSGLTAVAGVNLGLILQLATVAAGLSWLVDLFARNFDIVRYAGAAYLAFLGIQQLLKGRKIESGASMALRAERAFARGLAVAFANPKTLIFHAAFLPQFLSGGENVNTELWLLVATFAIIAALGDSLYALLAARVRTAISDRAQRVADKASGVILLGGAAVLLAAARR